MLHVSLLHARFPAVPLIPPVSPEHTPHFPALEIALDLKKQPIAKENISQTARITNDRRRYAYSAHSNQWQAPLHLQRAQ